MKRFALVLLVVMLIIPWGFLPPKVAFGGRSSYWVKTYGGVEDDWLFSIQQTSDGGYIVGGDTQSFGAGNRDILILKLDSQGNIVWNKTFGGSGDEYCTSVQQTSDGGYIVGGYTQSFGAGNWDILILKLDSQGNIVWNKTFGGVQDDRIPSNIQQTSDGGYILGCYSSSFGAGNRDILILKLDSQGNIVWNKTFGGSGDEYCTSVQQTSDGGYILGCYSSSFGAGNLDVLIIKLDAQGDVSWIKVFGGVNKERFTSVQQTSDGGYIVGCETASFTPDGSTNTGVFYILVAKLNSQGDISWAKIYGKSTGHTFSAIHQTSDTGYIVSGDTNYSFSLENDIFLLKLDSQGDISWVKVFGGNKAEFPNDTQQISDGYICGGSTRSFGAGGMDLLVMKVDTNGIIEDCNGFRDALFPKNDLKLSTSSVTNITITDPSLSSSTPQSFSSDASLSVNTICEALPIDTTPPEIDILLPQDNSFTNQKTILVKGRVKDEESGINNLFITGELVEVSSGTFEKEITLDEGENQIDIMAEDNAGNRVEKVMKIVLDTAAPQIILNSTIPLDTHAPTLVITGQVVDKGLSGIKANAIQINGVSLPLSRSFTFSYNLNLTEGLNQIILIVEDNAGNQTKLNYSVNYIKNIVLKLQIGKKVMYVNDKPVFLDVAPIIIENRTLLPIRWVAEPLGAKVDWDATERKVTVSLGSTTIELWIGKSTSKVNGIDVPIDPDNPKVVPEIINSRTMLPLRFIAENLGCDVQWDGKNKTVTITYPTP